MTLRLPDSGAATAPDGRRMVPSAERNAEAILGVLEAHAPRAGLMLELAAGSGLHSARFSAALPGLVWQPTDVDAANFPSIRAWATTSSGQVQDPVLLDATLPGWSAIWQADAVLLVNLLHLIPMAAAETLLAELARALRPGGTGFLYGPFLRDGLATSPGDQAFDASLRAQDPLIGYKDLGAVTGLLARSGLAICLHEMPANNVLIRARRT